MNIAEPFQRALKVEVSRGDNVAKMPHATGGDELFAFPPSSKRQKTSHQASSPSSGLSADDPLDGAAPGSFTFVNSQSASQATSLHSHASGVQVRKPAPVGSVVSEFRTLEQRMNSNPNVSRKKRTGARRSTETGIPSSPLTTPTSQFNPIEISADDEVEKSDPSSTQKTSPSLYRGTASNKSPAEQKRSVGQKTMARKQVIEGRSRFFGNFPRGNQKPAIRQPQERGAQDKNENLRHQFVSTNGHRRSMDIEFSSDADELNIGTTVGAHPNARITFSNKSSQPRSPSKGSSSSTLENSRLPEDSTEPGCSNIPVTEFRPTLPTGQDSAQSKREDALEADSIEPVREAKAPWSCGIAAVRLRGEIIRDNSMGLQFNKKSETYTVRKAGVDIPLSIRPDKLQKIIWGHSSRKVRFESSKVSGRSDHIVDLELNKEKDVAELVNKLWSQSLRSVKSFDSEHMDRIFEKRRLDFLKMTSPTRNVQQVVQRKETKDIAEKREAPDASGNAIPRTPGIVDQLVRRAAIEEIDEHSLHHPPSLPPIRDDPTKGQGTDVAKGNSSVSKILESLNVNTDHNNHLKSDRNGSVRRSLRTSGMTQRVPQDLFSSLDEVPVELRYSKTHGLGPEWKKPLVYPNVGKKKTTVEWSDLERLDEGQFLNDNLISFYLRFLEQRLGEERPELSKRVYFFNTFFYATLTNAERKKQWINYEGVQKWTRSVDLFTYDYIIVPINEAAHWYLAIICNLPALDRDVMSGIDRISPAGAINTTGLVHENPDLVLTSNKTANEGLPSTLVGETAEPDEKGTRSSFAEMSLATEVEQNITSEERHPNANYVNGECTGKMNRIDDDQEMLDTQAGQSVAKPSNLEAIGVRQTHPLTELGKAVENELGDTNQHDDAAAASLKKRKRKSLPPVMAVDPDKPVIVTFDSLGHPRSSTVRALKYYLHEEGKAKRGGMEWNDKQIKGVTAKQIPQQDNFSDCGLFLLGYVDKLLEDSPKDFIVKIIKRQYDQKKDWPKVVPSDLRANIRDQVQQLHQIQQDERRESAKQSGNCNSTGGHKLESTPSRAGDVVRNTRHEPQEHKDRPVERQPQQSNAIQPATRNEALATARSIDADDVDGATAKALDDNERFIEATGTEETNTTNPSPLPDEPSVITIDSQSQQDLSDPRPKHHFDSTPGEPESFDLPSTIPDSQKSGALDTTKTLTDVPRAAPSVIDSTFREDAPRQEPPPKSARKNLKRVMEIDDRSMRKKSGRKPPPAIHKNTEVIDIDDD